MNKLLILALVILFVLGCTKKENYKSFDFKGDLAIHFYVYSEFGYLSTDRDSIEVAVEGTDPLVKVYTDTAGNCLITNLPLGTYNLICSKKGFTALNWPGYGFLGNEYPKNINLWLYQNTSIRIKNYDFTYNADSVILSGIISHANPINAPSWIMDDLPELRIYFSNFPNVSYENYLQSYSISTIKNKDTIFNVAIPVKYLNYRFLPQGNVYAIIYGQPNTAYQDYDPVSNRYLWHLLGEPSDVKSVFIP